MRWSDIEKIEIYRLYPGSPPEHLRQFLQSVDSPSEIEQIMLEVQASQHSINATYSSLEGQSIRELIVKLKDGSVKRLLLRNS